MIYLCIFIAKKVIAFFSTLSLGLPRQFSGKGDTCQAADMGLIPGLGRSPGKGNGYPFQYSCLGNPMHREACWVTVHGVTKESDTTQQFNNFKLIVLKYNIYLPLIIRNSQVLFINFLHNNQIRVCLTEQINVIRQTGVLPV